MDLLAEIFGRLFSIAFGLGFVSAFFAITHYRAGARWRQVADAYPMPQLGPQLGQPLSERRFENVLLHNGGMIFNSYRWWLTARIYSTGVGLSLPPPLSIGHPPIFIPFSEATIETYPWYLVGDAYEIKTLRTPDIKIIIDDALANAIEGNKARHAARA